MAVFLRTTIPTKQRNDYLIAWLRRPLRSPEIPDLYSPQWSCWIEQLVRDWRDEGRAVMAVRTYLGSRADDAVECLERDLERYAVWYFGTFGHWTVDCDADRYVEREVERIFGRVRP